MATTNDITDVVKGIVKTYITAPRPIYRVNFIWCHTIWDDDEQIVATEHHIKLLEMHKMMDLLEEPHSNNIHHNRHLDYLINNKCGKIFKVFIDYWENEIKSKNLKCYYGSWGGEKFIILDVERIA